MTYLTKEELRRLFTVAHENNRLHHLCLLVALFHGFRVSEIVGQHLDDPTHKFFHPGLQGIDVADGQISMKRLKRSRATIHDLKITADPLFDESPLIEMAKQNPGRLFPFSRQRVDQFVRHYGEIAGIHPAKCHSHVFKHSICMILWNETHDLNAIQDHVGHKDASSTLVYMRQDSAAKAQQTVAALAI